MNVRTRLKPPIRLATVALAMCLSLTACSDNDDDNPEPDTTVADATADGVSDASSDTDATDTTPATASLQIIYEVAEPAASEVDLFINNELVADNIQYQQATTFQEVPANTELSLQVADAQAAERGGSDTTLDPGEATFGDPKTATLDPESTNQIVVHGVANTQDYSVGGIDVDRDIGLAIAINRNARREATNVEGETEVNLFHASIDTPPVDILADNRSTPALEDLDYGSFSGGYIPFEEGRHVFNLTPLDDNNDILHTFQTGLFETENVLTVTASGFTSEINSDGDNPGFSIVAYETDDPGEDELIDGQTLATAARVQFVHASPDPEASTVDVYLNDNRRFDEFSYKDATPFITVQSGVNFDVDITEPAASDTDNPLVPTQEVTFQPGSTQILTASGVVNPSEWEGDFEPLSFQLRRGNAVNNVPDADDGSGSSTPQAALQIFHGSTDAGRVRPEISVPDQEDPRRLNALNYTQYLSDVRGDGLPIFLDASSNRTLTIRNSAGTAIGSSYIIPFSDEALQRRNSTLITTGVLTAEGDPADAVPFEIFLVTERGETIEPVPAN